jgi:arylsulfatase A-like enzyme
MRRRDFLPALGAPLLAQAQTARTNILLIMADDLGMECLGCYGGTSYKTPRLDGLAASGVRFTHAYAQPLCTPTRVQLMTGKYNFRNWRAFGILDPKERTFGHMMREAGYQTCVSGKWQLYSYHPPEFMPEWRGKGMRPEQSGFDDWCLWHAGHTEVKGSRYADPIVEFKGRKPETMKGKYGPDIFVDHLCDFMTRNQSKPFFAYYPMALTHDPFNPTPRSGQWKTGNRLEHHTRFFGDMVEYMDSAVGRLVDHLDKLKLREKTLVLFYSDNGTHWSIESRMGDRVVRGGKRDSNDAGMHVPLIASWPGSATPNVCSDLIDSTYFVPTIAEAGRASMNSMGVIDGQSFLPQIRGETGSPRDWMYCWYDPKPGVTQMEFDKKIFARDKRYKLYRDGYLFDCERDPEEKNPLPAGAHPEIRAKLNGIIDRFAQEGGR